MPLAHCALPTRDLDRAAAFFELALGWRRLARPGNIDVPAAWLEIAPGQELHLIELTDFEPSSFEREYGRHIAIAVPRADFPALRERLARHGAELIDALRPTPFERFFFRAPDGYVFEVVDAGRAPEV